jgi:hypothetical protein
MFRVGGGAMLGGMMTYYRAWENRRFVRGLLREKQPELAAALESLAQERPCLLCRGSQGSMASRLTPPLPSQLPQPRRHMAPAGHAARPARGRRPQPSRIQ